MCAFQDTHTHTHTQLTEATIATRLCWIVTKSISLVSVCEAASPPPRGLPYLAVCVCVCVCVHGQTQTHRHRHRHRHRHKHRHRHRHRHTDTDTDTHPHTLHTTYTCLACRSYPVPDNIGSTIGLPHTSRKRFKEGLSKTREASTTPWSGGILTGYLCSGTCWCVLGFITANVTLMKLPAFRRM